jgi:hypothetical protein
MSVTTDSYGIKITVFVRSTVKNTFHLNYSDKYLTAQCAHVGCYMR